MAIFQDQPINLETVRGVSPERFVQRAERQQQAIVGDFLRMQQGIQAGIQEFEQKRAEKQNMQASLQLLKELGAVEGLSDESIKAGIKNAGGATNFLKTLGEMQAMEEQSMVRQAQQRKATAEASQAAQSQEIEAINLNAREQAIAINTRPDGSVDVEGLGSTYTQLGGRDADDIKLFSEIEEQAKAGKDPVIKTLIIDGFEVLLVDGEFKQARGVGGDEADPAQVKVMKAKSQQYKKARELYEQGDVAGSQAELIGIGVKDMFGRPMQPEEAFPDVTPAALPTPIDTRGMTPEQIAAFREQYLTPQP